MAAEPGNGEPCATAKEWSYPMNAGTVTTNAQRRSVFTRVLVGIDGSEESREAARQAAILVDGELTLLAAYDVPPAIGGTGTHVPAYMDEDLQREAATGSLRRARNDVATASPRGRIVRGRAATALISEAEREQDTLLVVGSHGLGRLSGFVIGSTATEIIHKAPVRCWSPGKGARAMDSGTRSQSGSMGRLSRPLRTPWHVDSRRASTLSYHLSSPLAVSRLTGGWSI